MSSIQIKQIKCPECGGQANSIGLFSSSKKCVYCHTEFVVTGTMEKEMEVPERILPFNTNREDFEKEVLTLFAQEPYAPNDIFDFAAFKDIDGVFLPMYLYEGKYECSWNCSVGYYENEVVASSDGKSVKNKQVLRYRPQSGTTKRDFAIVCAAYEGEEIKPELIEYARALYYDRDAAKSFDEKYLEDYDFVLHNLDKEYTWDKYGINSVEYIAEQDSLEQVPGDTYKDFRCSVSTDEKHKGRLVFLPFWMVYYDYNNEQHYVIMDGTGKSGLTGSTPIDEERVKAVNKWHDLAKYVKWGAWASLIAILWWVWGIPLVAWLAYFSIKFYAKFNENKIIKENKKIRETKLKEILDGGNN